MKKTFIGYKDRIDYTEEMSFEEMWMLFNAILCYQNWKEIPNLANVKFVWSKIKKEMEQNEDKRNEICEKRRIAWKKWWENKGKNSHKAKIANASKWKQMKADSESDSVYTSNDVYEEIWDNKLSHKESEDAFMNVWNSIPTAKWWNEKEWRKMYEQKIQNWMSWEMMYKLASLSKFEIREKVKEIMYSQKKENWIRDVCPQTDDEMEARIVDILKARYKRMEEWIKFKVNTVQELCDMFGQEYIWKLRKAVQVEAKKRFNL